MNPDTEIDHLLELMPASGRMMTKIVSKPQSARVIETSFPLPWQRGIRSIAINFDLWRELSRPQRDLVLLRAVSVLTGVKWFKPDLYQGIIAVGALGSIVELLQADAVGSVVGAGLMALAAHRLWRNQRGTRRELEADETAIGVAVRRGYTEVEAARHLLSAIDALARIEGRSSLSFTELVRSRNLEKLANLSSIGVPDNVREES